MMLPWTCQFCRARQAEWHTYTLMGQRDVQYGPTETIVNAACEPCYDYVVSLPPEYRRYLVRLASGRSDGR